MRYQSLRCLGLTKLYPSLKPQLTNSYCSETKSDSKDIPESWRKPWSQKAGEWYSGFKMFEPRTAGNVDYVRILQTKIDGPKAILKWWRNFKKETDILDQRYIPQRHETLGSNLAAAHFLVHRGASVRFKDSSEWIRRVKDHYPLPDRFEPDYVIEAIDLLDMTLYFEGFRNMTDLKFLKWLSLKNSEELDDWGIDWISAEYRNTLEYLDISNCRNVTHRGIGALYRMEKLRVLKVSGISDSYEFQLVCLMLEDLFPKLKIEGVTYIDVESSKV